MYHTPAVIQCLIITVIYELISLLTMQIQVKQMYSYV